MSIATTILGGKVSFTTSGTNDPAAGRVEIAVPLTVSNTADLTGGDLLPAVITAKPTTSNVVAGELSLTSHSANSITLTYRSGSTLYVWTNTQAVS
jgi:hypothetical protein